MCSVLLSLPFLSLCPYLHMSVYQERAQEPVTKMDRKTLVLVIIISHIGHGCKAATNFEVSAS